jgi:dihydrodipicolinate reductase
MTNVAVLGAKGRMGSETCRAVKAAEHLELVAALGRDDPLTALTDAAADVVVDFTSPDAVMDNLRWCADHGLHAVVGTTGFTPERLDEVRGWLGDAPRVGVLVAPNFSVAAVLMMRFGVPLSSLPQPARRQARRRCRMPPPRSSTAPAAPTWGGSACTAYGYAGSLRTRRCCSAPPARR